MVRLSSTQVRPLFCKPYQLIRSFEVCVTRFLGERTILKGAGPPSGFRNMTQPTRPIHICLWVLAVDSYFYCRCDYEFRPDRGGGLPQGRVTNLYLPVREPFLFGNLCKTVVLRFDHLRSCPLVLTNDLRSLLRRVQGPPPPTPTSAPSYDSTALHLRSAARSSIL